MFWFDLSIPQFEYFQFNSNTDDRKFSGKAADPLENEYK